MMTIPWVLIVGVLLGSAGPADAVLRPRQCARLCRLAAVCRSPRRCARLAARTQQCGRAGMPCAAPTSTTTSTSTTSTSPTPTSFNIAVLEQGDASNGVPAALIHIDPVTGDQSDISSGGLFSNDIGENPNGFALDPYSDKFLVVDRARRLISIDAGTGAQSLVTSGVGMDPTAIVVESPGRFLIADYYGSLLRFDSTSDNLSVVASGGLIGGVAPFAVQLHANGDAIVSALTAGGYDVPGPPSRVIRIDPASGVQTLIAEITDGQFRDFALTDTYALIAISSRGYPAGADTLSKLDLATGVLTPVVSGLQRALDVDFARDGSLLILDQVLSLPCCPPWVPVVYSAAQDGSALRIVSQGGKMFVPGRLVVF